MALLTLAEYKTFVGITSTDATRDAALTMMIAEVNDAIKRYLHNGEIELTDYTVVLDAPVSLNLVLPVIPVYVEDFAIYFNQQANGDPAAFTAADLLTPYTDYTLQTSLTDTAISKTGIVTSQWGAWGVGRVRPALALASQLVPIPGAIKAVFAAGYDPVPPSIQAAACLVVSKLYNMRRAGQPATNESLQSYSIGYQSAATADGIIQGDPTVRNLLKPFGRQIFVGAYN